MIQKIFQEWHDEYFGDAGSQNEPYKYEDIESAFLTGYNLGRFNPHFSVKTKMTK
jgi:hypothetical protein